METHDSVQRRPLQEPKTQNSTLMLIHHRSPIFSRLHLAVLSYTSAVVHAHLASVFPTCRYEQSTVNAPTCLCSKLAENAPENLVQLPDTMAPRSSARGGTKTMFPRKPDGPIQPRVIHP